MRPDPIKRFEEMVKEHGEVPKRVTMTHYRSFEDWHCTEDGPATEADFFDAQKRADCFAEHVASLGVIVRGVEFDPGRYAAWRGERPDTRHLRAEWAVKHATISLAFTVHGDGIGWAVLQEGEE